MDIFLKEDRWYGRENESICLFVLKYLAPKFPDPTQIGIESAVQQLPGSVKKLVRKDLVIWSRPEQTVWDDRGNICNFPLSIIEWKTENPRKCQRDIHWLSEYTKLYPAIIGYSVCVKIKSGRGLSFKKIMNGRIIQ